MDFIDFMVTFQHDKYAFDVPKGKITLKSKIDRPILNMNRDVDNDPKRHPYYIIDPFDLNHNPGKQVKFQGQSLFKEYTDFFKELQREYESGKILKKQTMQLLKPEKKHR